MEEAELPSHTTVKDSQASPDETDILRLISVHGDIRDLDEVIDELLGKDEERKRKFGKG